MLSVSRWYRTGIPFETYRTLSLAQAALKQAGISHPEKHIALVLYQPTDPARIEMSVATLLVSPKPISQQAIAQINQVAREHNFTVLASPDITPIDPVIAALTRGDFAKASTMVPGNIAPPTDNRPFFFNFIRLQDLLLPSHWKYQNTNAVGLLLLMAVAVIMMLLWVVIAPLRLTGKRIDTKSAWLAAYFIGIGIGFMAVEIGFLQRFSIFFGHPSFSLIVVLPTILAASGLGSLASGHKLFNRLPLAKQLFGLALILLLISLVMPWFTAHGAAWETPVRVLAAIAFLTPASFLMGMPFAKGMRLASRQADDLKPWLWGLNGAASVAASVLAVLLSILAGINFAFYLGIAGYLLTALAARRLKP
jgi:hypothetical protein